jgi:excisionase family DNA binding protein
MALTALRPFLYVGVLWQRLPSAAVRIMNNGDILTLPEMAELLRVAEKTVYTLAQRGEIPAFKVGGQWRFSRGAIEVWIDEQSRSACQPNNERTPSAESGVSTERSATKAKTGRRR